VDGGWTAAGRAPDDVERLAERLRSLDSGGGG